MLSLVSLASREAPQRRNRRTAVEELTDQLNLRAAISDINAFVDWCEQQRMSYREAFGRLGRMIEQAATGRSTSLAATEGKQHHMQLTRDVARGI